MFLFTVFFLVIGITLIAIAIVSSDQLDEACSSTNSDGDFQKALRELYSRADAFYCTQADCTWYVGTYTPGPSRTAITPTNTTTSVDNVQGCQARLTAAYADYGVDFSDINDIIEYLDYFGDVEKEYKCSGICTKQDIYYFSVASAGKDNE